MFVDTKMSRACCALTVKFIIFQIPHFQLSIHTESVQDELSVPLVNIMERALLLLLFGLHINTMV